MIDQIESNESLSLSAGSKAFLKETAGWAKFLAIIGFVGLGLMIIAGLFAGSFMATLGGGTGMSGTFFTVFYIVFALIYFFPIYYLYQFSSKMKLALQHQSGELLTAALENLKSVFKYMGILTIIILGFYAIALLFAGLGAAFM